MPNRIGNENEGHPLYPPMKNWIKATGMFAVLVVFFLVFVIYPTILTDGWWIIIIVAIFAR